MDPIAEPDFDLLFHPRSVALIGASKDTGKWGAIILLNIILGGYRGKIYPVNPKEESIFGHKAYPLVSRIPEPVDLAVITIPASGILAAIRDCLLAGVRMAVVITSDFSETGEEGARLEEEMVALALSGGLRLVGPNTMGAFSSPAGLVALMPPVRPQPGPVSFFSQSGNIGAQMLSWGERLGVGFSKFVSSGNEGDLRAEDYLAYFGRDPETRVILGYIEGLDDGRKFFETARKITPEKPVIILKGGLTEAGARAAKSHSGAMAGVKALYEAAFRQSGIVWAGSTEEMLECAAAFARLPLPGGNRVGILTRGGGWGVITADACMRWGLSVPPLSESLIRDLDRILPSFWSKGNPVDLVATIAGEAYLETTEKLIAWDQVDLLISLSGDSGPLAKIVAEVRTKAPGIIPAGRLEKMADDLEASRAQYYRWLQGLIQKYGKPIIGVGTHLMPERKGGENFGPPQFSTPERAARTAALLCDYARYRRAIGAL